ncbi:DNA topoisomerase [Thermodesulfobacteriota bacterium]
MAKMLVVVDSEDKIAALQSQFDGDPELFVLSAPPLKVLLKPSVPGQQSDKGKFSFTFAPLESGQPLLKKLQQYAGSDIYLAFDPDPRGEFMSWLVAKSVETVSPGASPPRRLHLLALHAEELRESFRQVEPIREDWAIGYHDRAVFDVAFGKHIKRLLGTQTGPAGVPLTTACLTTLFHLAEREKEVKAYLARPRQCLMVKLDNSGDSFLASLVYAFGVTDNGDLSGVKDVEAAIRLLRDVEFVVQKVVKSELVVVPPAPYRLVELLEDAYLLRNLSLGKTLAVVRQLFDGVDVDGVATGLITTPSAVSVSLMETIEKIRLATVQQLGKDQLSAAVSVAAGEGFLLPTRPDLEGEEFREVLGDEGCFVYEQIRRRALASQMQPAVGERFVVEVKAGEHCFFKAVGSAIGSPGHLAVYQGGQGRNLLEPNPLDALVEGVELAVEQLVPEAVELEVSPFYNIDSLFGDLVDFGIDPGLVGISMLDQLIAEQYVEILPSGELRCRENAHKVVATLDRAFPTMQGINLSAYLEQTVGEVLSGRKALDVALRQFDQTMVMKGNVLRKFSVSDQVQARLRKRKPKGVIKGGGPPPAPSPVLGSSQSIPVEVAVEEDLLVSKAAESEVTSKAEPLPEQGPVVVEEGVAVAPELVDVQISAETEMEAQAVEVASVSLSAEASVGAVEKPPALEEEISSVGLAFDGLEEPAAVESVPVMAEDARQAAELFNEVAAAPVVVQAAPEPAPVEDAQEAGLQCPVCRKGQIMHKKTPTGKPFYVCPREECEFMAWAVPHPLPCQVCGSSFLVEKKDLHGHLFLRCPKAGCNYRQPLPGDDGAALLAAEQEGVQKKKKVLVRRVAKGATAGGKKRKVLVRRRK